MPSGTGARVQIEDRFRAPILQDLTTRGHRFQKIGRKGEVRYGYAALVTVDVAADASKAAPNPGARMPPSPLARPPRRQACRMQAQLAQDRK